MGRAGQRRAGAEREAVGLAGAGDAGVCGLAGIVQPRAGHRHRAAAGAGARGGVLRDTPGVRVSQRAARRHVRGAGQRLDQAGGGGRAAEGAHAAGAGQGADGPDVPEAAAAEDGVLQGAGGRAEQPDGAAGGVSHLPAPGRGELLVPPGEGAVLRHVLLRGARAVSRADGGGAAEGWPVAGPADRAPGDGAGEGGAAECAAERAGAMPEKR